MFLGMLIDKEQKKQLERVAERYHLTLILLFGSAVSGGRHAGSDLDIAISSELPLGWREYGSFIEDMKSMFGVESETIDVSFLDRADPLFLKRISEQFQALVGDDAEIMKFRLKAFHRYEDYRPYLAQEREAVRAYLQHQAYVH